MRAWPRRGVGSIVRQLRWQVYRALRRLATILPVFTSMQSSCTSSLSEASMASRSRVPAEGVCRRQRRRSEVFRARASPCCARKSAANTIVSNSGVSPRAWAGSRSAACETRQSPAQSTSGCDPSNEIMERFSSGSPAVCDTSSRISAISWRKRGAYRFADINENRDLQFRPVGAGKALKIADDNILVYDSEVAGLQRGHAVIVLVHGGEVHPHLAGRRCDR